MEMSLNENVIKTMLKEIKVYKNLFDDLKNIHINKNSHCIFLM